MKTFSCCNISTWPNKDKGFLLLELLVAVFVLVSMGTVAWSLLARACDYAGRAQRLMCATNCAVQAYEQAQHEAPADLARIEGIFKISRTWHKDSPKKYCLVQVTWDEKGKPFAIHIGKGV